jgi:hypothetical protein
MVMGSGAKHADLASANMPCRGYELGETNMECGAVCCGMLEGPKQEKKYCFFHICVISFHDHEYRPLITSAMCK